MRKIVLLSLILIIFSYNNAFAYEPTSNQKAFGDLIASTPGVTHVEWTSPFSLWVGVTLSSLGNPPKERAKEIADTISSAAKNALGQSVCVHVYYGNGNQLARSCSY